MGQPYNLEKGDDILVKISAKNTLGYTSESEPINSGLKVINNVPLNAPVVNQQEDSAKLDISWTYSSCASSYQLYANGELVYNGQDTSTEFEISTAVVKEYSFEIRFTNGDETSIASDATTFICNTKKCSPGAFENPTLVAPKSCQYFLDWSHIQTKGFNTTYSVQIKNDEEKVYYPHVFCYGQKETECYIPVSKLTDIPFNLT